MRYLILAILCLSLFSMGCSSEGSGIIQNSKKVVSVDNSKVTFSDGSTHPFKEGESVIFLIPNAEHIKDSTKAVETAGLIFEGQERAKLLVNIFEKADLGAVMSSTQVRSALTVQPLGAAKKIGILNYNSDSRQRIFDFVFQFNPGQKFVLVGEYNSIPLIISDLTGKDIGPNLAEDDHEKFYVISGVSAGNCSINEFSY